LIVLTINGFGREVGKVARAKVIKNFPYNEGNLRDPRMNRVIVLENLNFIFDESELNEINELWDKDSSLTDIAEYFKRDPDEIFLALFHLSREKKIKRRRGGLF
jgi:hypothetical protein